ncbi:MAG: fused MFS/spermidine synthase [Oscillospiraceae bacterium]|nr:fused MFS/spermidine synthase [Oscillospiraceae bacterium]
MKGKLDATKAFIYVTSFLSGMSVMAAELSASRLLSPYFSSTLPVWSVIIGLIMASLSIGNVVGGRAADRHGSLSWLYRRIVFAAAYIALIPLIGKYVIAASAPIFALFMDGGIVVFGSALSCLILFAPPMVILGMVSPYMVRLGAKDAEGVGRAAGNVYAVSTVGSIIGTFIPSFLTIPTIGTNMTFASIAITLSALSVAFFAVMERKAAPIAASSAVLAAIIATAVFVLPGNSSFAFWEKGLVYEGESLYNYVQVKKSGETVLLSTNVAFGVQSAYRKGSVLSGFYYDYALASLLMSAPIARGYEAHLDGGTCGDGACGHRDDSLGCGGGARILILGLGSGTYAKECRYFLPDSEIVGVEIDPLIIEVARLHFDLRDDEVEVHEGDGRIWLEANGGPFDVVMLDAYQDISIPFHMATAEFFALVKGAMAPGGVAVINVNLSTDGDTGVTDALATTAGTAFGHVYVYDIASGTNTLIFAADDGAAAESLRHGAELLPDGHMLARVMDSVSSRMDRHAGGTAVLTDDLAPIELMTQKVMDGLISQNAKRFKDMVSESPNGIFDIFDIIKRY